jgi:hypothetical protein
MLILELRLNSVFLEQAVKRRPHSSQHLLDPHSEKPRAFYYLVQRTSGGPFMDFMTRLVGGWRT